MEHVDCIFCHKDDTEPFMEENGHSAVRCRGCGLVYVNPRPSIGQMKELYDGQETFVEFHKHLQAVERKQAEARSALRFVRRYRSRGRLLEIGSAAGYFLKEARDSGFEVQGLDLTRPFVQFSKEVLGVPSFEGILREAPFPDGSFDVIYHRNVLSHLADPVDEFTRMRRLLAPGGILVFETGNVGELAPDPGLLLELPDHLYHFSEKTIRMLLESSGFRHLETYRFALLSQLPFVRSFERRGKHKSIRERRERPQEAQIPKCVPPCRLGRKIHARLSQFVRYDLGQLLPTAGRRCTLVVIARKNASA